MKNVIELLNGNFKIIKIIIENFTISDSTLKIQIQIQIESEEYGVKTLVFKDVSNIDINSSYYSCSDNSSIITEDLSEAQIEGVNFKVAISEDVMTFYCKEIYLE